MEIYKKPVIANCKPSSSTVMRAVMPFPAFFLGDKNFHVEKSLSPRKNIVK